MILVSPLCSTKRLPRNFDPKGICPPCLDLKRLAIPPLLRPWETEDLAEKIFLAICLVDSPSTTYFWWRKVRSWSFDFAGKLMISVISIGGKKVRV